MVYEDESINKYNPSDLETVGGQFVQDSGNITESQFQYFQRAKQAIDNQIRWQLDQDPILEKIKRELQGHEWSDNRQCWVYANDPICSDMLISKIMTSLRSIGNINAQLNHLRPHEIDRIVKQKAQIIVDMAVYYGDDGGLNQGDRDNLVSIIEDYVYLVLKRSDGAGEREFINKSVKVQQTDLRTSTDDKKRGFLNWNG